MTSCGAGCRRTLEPVWRRNQPEPESVETGEPVDSYEESTSGKGHPTPKRKDAEAARKQSLKIPADPKAARRAARERERAQRGKQREAMLAGVESALPPRDRGPVRRFTRNWVDGHRLFAEFFLPLVLLVLILSLLPNESIRLFASLGWYFLLIVLIVDIIFVAFRLRRALTAEFPDKAERKGAVFYGVMRALQIRRLRVPVPMVGPGGKPVKARKK